MALYDEFLNYQNSQNPQKKKKKKQNEVEKKRDLVENRRNSINIAPVQQNNLISDETKEFAKNTVLDFLGNQFKVNEFKDIWSNGYDFGDIRKTINTAKSIISPVEQTKQKVSSTITNLANSDGKLFKENKAIKEAKNDLKSLWSNGYQVGDIGKSKNAIQNGITKTILGTTADVGTNLLKGELQTAEGLVDTGRYVASDLVKAAGYNETADKIKERAIQNTTGFILGENDLYNNPKENGWAKKVDEYSVFGDKIDQINQSLGQQAFRIGLSKALMGKAPEGGATDKLVKGLNQVEIFAGSYGQAKSEALMNGADEKTANLRGIISGTAEYISENLFDSLPGFKTGELKGATKLKDIIGKSAQKAFGKNGGKAIVNLFNGFGEGFEEILSNVLDTIFTDTLNYVMPEYTYGMKEGQGLHGEDNILLKQIKDIVGSATSKESKEAFITSLISTFITGTVSNYANTQQRQQIIEGYAQDNNMSVEKATELFDAISQLRQNQLVDENTGFTERMETEENVNQQLQQEIQNGANLEELFKATPKTRAEKQFTFTKDELRNVKTEQDRILANSLENINNEKSVHETYKVVSAVQKINKTQQYKLTTTEGLYQMGIIDKTSDGKYVMKDGSEYVPRGLNNADGVIYVNVDVGTKSGTQAMYHEMFEGFKKASPKEYEQFKQMVTDIVGSETIENEVAQYSKMYEGGKTNDIRDEIINDKFGELAENQKFINRLADNRTLLEKIIDNVKNMVKYVKGTQQEKDLIKLQNKLEKEFAKRYKKTDFSQNEGETAYSLGKHFGDLGKGDDTYYGHMYDSRRSTGHFGTGTYFVNENYQPGEHSSYATRPSKFVEFDDYDNLFKPSNRDEGFDLHDGLKEINYNNTPISKDLYDKLLPYYEASFKSYNDLLDEDYENDYKNVRNLLEEAGVETEEPNAYYENGRGQYGNTYEKYLEDKITDVLDNYDRYQKAERDLKRILKLSDEQFNEAIDKVRQTEKEYQNHSYDQKLKDDSLSTVFMKTLGYNGVDVRGIEGLDDTQYGSVIYDLNKKSVNNTDDKINNLLLTNSDVYDMVDSKTLKENGLTVDDLISKGLDDIDKLEDAWRKANYENSSKDFHEVPIEEAVSTIRDNNAFWRLSEGWFRGADSSYKPNIERLIIMTPELRNAGMNIAYQNYKDYIDKNISFKDFINKDITLYRGSNYDGFVDADKFIAFSYRKDMVEKHFGNRNKDVPISEIKVKIKDTLGSYQTTGEAEVLVPRSIVDANNIRYSLTTNKDSNGRTLTKEQQNYFKDSKVVDEDGNLMVMYHGTESNVGLPENEKFTIFDRDRAGSHGTYYGAGFYFTPYSETAQDYAKSKGDVYETYLNMTNPYIPSADTINEDGSVTFAPTFYEDFENRFKEQLPQYWNDEKTNKGRVVRDILQDNGYDGIINGDTYVVFEPNQIKNVDNTNPTENPDIRYSLAPTGEMVDNNGNKVTFDVSEVETDIPIRDESKLMVLHNLGENKMNGIMDLDGIPVPSLAVTNPYKVDHNGFGEGTLIFRKETINPTNRLNEVYDRDIWSPTYPRIEYDIDNQVLRDMARENNFNTEEDEILRHAKLQYLYSENLSNIVDNGIDFALDRMKSDRELKYLYQKSTNPDYQAQFKAKEYSNKYSNETLQKYVDLYNSNKFNDMSLYDFWYHYLNYGDMKLTDDQTKALKATIRDIVYKEYVAEGKDLYNRLSDETKSKILEDEYVNRYVENQLNIFDKSYFDYVNFIRDAVGLDQYGEQLTIDEDATLKQVEQDTNQKEYEKWVDDTFGKMLRNTKKGIRNDKELFTPSGNRRSFDKLHEEYNLENLVKILTSKDTVGGEEGFGSGSNFGTLQAKMGHKFNSIEDIKSYEDRLSATNNQDIEDLKNAIYDDMAELNNYKKYYSEYSYFDNAGYALNDYAEYKTQDLTNLKKALEKNDIDTTKVPTELLNKVVDEVNQLKTIPTDYFEAKPQRAVGLDEIGIGLIPQTWSDETKQRMKDKGIKYVEYDSTIPGERQRIEQSLTDYMFSLTSNQNIDSKEIAPVNTTTEEQIAPIRKDISNISTQLNNLSNQIETLQNGLENNPRGYVESYKEQRNENIPTRQLTEDEANLRQEALMNDEGYLRSLEEQANYDANDKFIKSLTNEIQPQLDVSKESKPRLEKLIRDAVENDLSADEINDRISREFSSYTTTFEDEGLQDVKKAIRRTPLKVDDFIKTDIADYNDFRKSNFGKMTFTNSGIPVDVAYEQLASEFPGYFPNDIVNPSDQLQYIAEVANKKGNTIQDSFEPDYLDNVSDYITDSILNYKANNQLDSQASLDKDIQFDFAEDIAPTVVRTQESVDDYIENRDIAPVRQEQVKPKSKIRDRFERMRTSLNEKIRNRNYIIDEYARATGNKEIKFTGDNLNNVSGETAFNINGYQTDINGDKVGKGVHKIFEPARKSGLYNAFNDYLVQKSNIERHAVGKGSQVPLVVSQQLVQQYEAENPQFKEWAKDVYKYFDNVLQDQVNEGLISQEKYNDFRGENGIYRSYVPFYPGEEIQSNIKFDDNGEVKSYTTLKKSKGNAFDVNKMLSVEDAMAKQTYAYKRAIRQNELFKEIVKSSEKYDAMFDGDMRDNPTNLDDSLFVDDEGNKVVSAYINGQKVSAKISDDLYNELSGANEQRIKQLEQDFSMITNPLQKASNIRRKLITTWNPAFLARNAIKDVQDAVINSKHTAKMLKNLAGLSKGHKPAIIELAQAKTQEAQRFLALYGSELYGDYSGKMNKFTKLNELIELAPRYAEYLASLQSGESQNEAMYNAREVTTNFGRGGYVTRALNRNGFTFLNANVQGLDKVVRNLSGENGAKGVVATVTKGALFAVLPSILNDLLYGFGDDKDEEYEALPDYIKDNYYLVKTEGNHFVRIPKGRINAVFGSLARRTIETIETGENQYDGYIDNAWSQIGVGDLGGNNIFSPITQAFGSENGTAWYGGDIVPTRLQKKPAEEQTDAKVDAISNFIGKTFNISPYKVNYVLDQYSGALGDIFLPMITEETKSGAETPVDYLTAPLKDAFSVNSTDDNKYAGEFYDTKDKLEIAKNSANATDEDVLKYKYMSGVSTQLSDLYKERREVQSDTTLSNKQKYEKVQKIQDAINSLAKEAMSEYKNIKSTENYSSAGDEEFYKNNKNEWAKVNDSDSEFIAGMTDTEKSSYFNVKNKINSIYDDYNSKVKGLSKNDSKRNKYAQEKRDGISQAIINSGLDDYSKAMIYSKYYSTQDKMTNVYNAGYDIDTYITAMNDLDQIRDKYSQKKGYSTEYRKKKTISYINSLNIEIPQKAMLIRNYYTSFRSYNKDIVNYVSNLDISYDEKVAILKDTGMTVNGNNVSWK